MNRLTAMLCGFILVLLSCQKSEQYRSFRQKDLKPSTSQRSPEPPSEGGVGAPSSSDSSGIDPSRDPERAAREDLPEFASPEPPQKSDPEPVATKPTKSPEPTPKPPMKPEPTPKPKPIARTPQTRKIMADVLFYDGYSGPVAAPSPPGVVRQSNTLVTRRLTVEDIAAIGNNLTVAVTLKAACDNYDRIGSVGFSWNAKGTDKYDAAAQHIEIGRFITPFMNKNVEPTSVPFHFKVDEVAKILQDDTFLSQYDLWVGLSIFGTTSAGQKEVSGCASRGETFFASLTFISTEPLPTKEVKAALHAISYNKSLNNYATGATDTIGQTVQTTRFTLSSELKDALLVVMTTSHGSAEGGEEYQRRQHLIYLDDKQIFSYTPGGVSCEPYRIYNTMGNGIYGPFPKGDWSWNNWCPGQAVPIRQIPIGTLAKGEHAFKIAVPAAEFRNKNGDIVVSAHIIGTH